MNSTFLHKVSSILDYQQEELSSQIWEDSYLKPEVKAYILDSVAGFFREKNMVGYNEWCTEALIGSSLATYFYKIDTDLDVKYIIDTELLKTTIPEFVQYSSIEITQWLVEVGRESPWLTGCIPGTLHALDVYFYPKEELEDLNLLKYDSLYVLSQDTWVKEPTKVLPGLSPSYVLEVAKDKAKPFLEKISNDIEKTKQDTMDFIILKDFMKNLEDDDLIKIQQEFISKLDIINTDIESLIEDKEFIKNLRHVEFTRRELDSDLENLMGSLNFSSGNLVFKILQRYGYLRILVEVNTLFEGRNAVGKDAEKLLDILS